MDHGFQFANCWKDEFTGASGKITLFTACSLWFHKNGNISNHTILIHT